MVEPDAFAFAGVTEIGAAFRSGTATPLQVVEAALARADALEPRLNAVIDTMREPALAAAEAATRELQAGRDRGPLHGIPVAIKDLIDVAGVPTTYATRAVDPAWPARDAVLVQRLREAGAVPLFKTNLLEFAYGVAHPAIGQTNNPWDAARTSGGSSGGSAALVAAGVVPLAVGTDTGGSIRIPAAYCGIVGVKPSYGIVSTEGVFPLSWSLDHAGPLARSVRDAAALLRGLTGQTLGFRRRRPIEGLRIGLVASHLDSGLVTPGVREHRERPPSTAWADPAPCSSTVAIAELDAVNHGLMTIAAPEAALIHETASMAARPQGYAQGTRAQLEAGAKVSAIDYVRAQRLRLRLTQAVEMLFRDGRHSAQPRGRLRGTGTRPGPRRRGRGGRDAVLRARQHDGTSGAEPALRTQRGDAGGPAADRPGGPRWRPPIGRGGGRTLPRCPVEAGTLKGS